MENIKQDQNNFESPPEADEQISQFSNFPKKKLVIWLLLAAVVVAGTLVWLLFFREDTSPEVQADARVRVEAPLKSVTGSEISYELKVENLSRVKLTEVTLEVFYPDGFEYLDHSSQTRTEDVEQTRSENREAPRLFQLTDLEPGSEHRIFIVGTLSGNLQEIKTLSARLRYVPENFRSLFELTTSADTVILPPALTLQIDGPSQIFAGQKAEYQVEVINEAETDFENLLVRFEAPNGFAANSETERELDSLRPGERRSFSFLGRFDQDFSGDAMVRSEILIEDNTAGRSFIFTEVAPVPLLLTQEVTRKSAGFDTERWTYEINWRNTSRATLEGVTLSLELESELFEAANLNQERGEARLTGSTLFWTPALNPELRLVAPGELGMFRFTVPFESDLEEGNYEIKTTTGFSSEEYPEGITLETFAEELVIEGEPEEEEPINL